MKLKLLFDDIKFSYKFAQTHLNVGMPGLMRTHAVRHRTDMDRLRETDTSTSRLTQFRDSIRNNSTDPDNRTGTDDYKQMVDVLIRRGGLLDHYAGPRDLKDWLELKNLKSQFQALMDSKSKDDLSTLWNNPGFAGARSVALLAYNSAVNEIQATVGEEVTPEIRDAILNEIVGELNGASAEVFGETITVDDFKQYIKDVGDGVTKPTDFTLSSDGWN
ncbi:hypothetical protein ACJ5H2_02625 [Nocardioides sp. R1-1]|uniref:hypothetical protein n=1 Tax=Nocardioides sp. R1-1 TaxID=3383502 RepID=UPI0038D05D23